LILATVLALGLHLHPCTEGHAKVVATCGTYGVYEDRAAKTGRILEINLVVLKARRPSHHAIAFVAGGPGQASADFAGFVADGAIARETRTLDDTYDVVFMDDRGMGKSHLLQCDFAPQNDPASYFEHLIPDTIVRACRSKLTSSADIALYNTNNAVDDLDDIRSALGYPKLVLDGGSYGTFFSLVYMRRHPEHVESAVLDGVDPPGFQPLPGEPFGAQTALDDLVVKCNRDAVCHTHFPHFQQQFEAFVALRSWTGCNDH
jgi:pimeloyl-ACP methyl ester carboxylesterase